MSSKNLYVGAFILLSGYVVISVLSILTTNYYYLPFLILAMLYGYIATVGGALLLIVCRGLIGAGVLRFWIGIIIALSLITLLGLPALGRNSAAPISLLLILPGPFAFFAFSLLVQNDPAIGYKLHQESKHRVTGSLDKFIHMLKIQLLGTTWPIGNDVVWLKNANPSPESMRSIVSSMESLIWGPKSRVTLIGPVALAYLKTSSAGPGVRLTWCEFLRAIFGRVTLPSSRVDADALSSAFGTCMERHEKSVFFSKCSRIYFRKGPSFVAVCNRYIIVVILTKALRNAFLDGFSTLGLGGDQSEIGTDRLDEFSNSPIGS